MKGLIKLVGLAVLSALLIFFGGQVLFTQETKPIRPTRPPRTQDTTKTPEPVQKETYVSKVIISAPWAKKNLVYGKEESPPGEFGYHVDEETAIGPSCFAVAPNGDIYIADPLNNRMQRFNSEGVFISTIPTATHPVDVCIDQSNNVYLLRYGWKPEELGDRPGTIGAVLKCDQKGNILKTYPVFTGVAATANFVYCDKFGRIFMACPGVGPYQVGTSKEVFSFDQQKNSEIKGFWGANSVPLDSNCFFQGILFPSGRWRALFLLTFKGDTLKTYRSYPPLAGSFFGCDENLNIYMYYWDRKASLVSIRKYDPNGNFLSTFEYRCEKPYHLVSGFGGSRSNTLDNKGNFYKLCYSEKDGIRVIKWYKQE
jgi:hypothetical protein